MIYWKQGLQKAWFMEKRGATVRIPSRNSVLLYKALNKGIPQSFPRGRRWPISSTTNPNQECTFLLKCFRWKDSALFA